MKSWTRIAVAVSLCLLVSALLPVAAQNPASSAACIYNQLSKVVFVAGGGGGVTNGAFGEGFNEGELITFTFSSQAAPGPGIPSPTADFTYNGVLVYSGSVPFSVTVSPTPTTNTWQIRRTSPDPGVLGMTFSCGLTTGGIQDGRENAEDNGALAAVYPETKSIDVYAIDPATGNGFLVGQINLSEYKDVPPPAENQLILSATNPYNGNPVNLYRLTTGEWQINTVNPDGTPYVYIWGG